MHGLLSERTVKRDKITFAKELIQRDIVYPAGVLLFVMGLCKDAHIHGLCYAYDLHAYIAGADDTESLSVKLDMIYAEMIRKVAVIAPGKHPMLLCHGGGQLQHKEHDCLCHSLGTVIRNIAYGYALFPGSGKIDVIVSCAGFTDQPDGIRELSNYVAGHGHLLCNHDGIAFYPLKYLILRRIHVNGNFRGYTLITCLAVIIHLFCVEHYCLVAYHDLSSFRVI